MEASPGFDHTQPASLDDGDDALAEFLVTAPAEVVSLLKRLVDAAAPVHLNAPDGGSCTTTLWTLDTARDRISFSGDDENGRMQQLVEGDELVAVAYLDHIKLQFDLSGLMLVRGAQSCALQADLPERLYRFQRRDTYRVRTGQRNAVVQLRHPALPEMMLTLRVLDVSMGGCAVFLPDDVPPLPPGVRLHRVQVALDGDTRFAATLVLHHVTALNPGSRGTRLGCSWLDIPGDGQRALQRWIDQTQKRRRLLSLD